MLFEHLVAQALKSKLLAERLVPEKQDRPADDDRKV
jgi:hypothetical protein